MYDYFNDNIIMIGTKISEMPLTKYVSEDALIPIVQEGNNHSTKVSAIADKIHSEILKNNMINMSQAEYDALQTKKDNTYYFTYEEE